MEKVEDEDFVKTFDTFYTNNHIEIMKTLLPYLSSKQREMMPVFIKFLELQDAIHKQKIGCNPWNCVVTPPIKEFNDIIPLYQNVKKYLSASEDQTCQQILQWKAQMDQMKQMQQLFEMFQGMNEQTAKEDAQNDDAEHKDGQEMDFMKLMQFMKDFS